MFTRLYRFIFLLLLICSLPAASYAGWWQDPSLGNSRGAATGNAPIFNSPYYNPNLPAGGLSPYVHNPALPSAFWRAPSGYYYPWVYGAYPTSYVYPVIYQSGTPVKANPPVTTVFSDMQNYLDDSKSKGRLSENDYKHLNQRLHDLIGKSQEIEGEGNSPDQDPDLQQDVKELGLDISHRLSAPGSLR